MDIVFSFEYENNEYLVIKNNNQYIPCKREKGIINYEITDKELSLINYVFNKIKTTDNRIKLSNFEYKDKEYQHLYDKTNNYHIFTNLDGSDIEKNIFSELNMLFNYQSDILYIGNNNKENRLKRLVNIGKKVILVLATSSALISPLAKLTPVHAEKIKIESLEIEENEQESNLTDEEKIENLKNSINENKNLNDKEKSFCLDRLNIIYDYIDSINYELLKERYDSFDIIYDEEYDKDHPSVQAFYSWDNKIYVYRCNDIENASKSVLTHEFFHIFQLKFNHSGLYEPVNDILVNEYDGIKNSNSFRKYSTGYDWIKPYIYALMEIIGEEPLIYNHLTGSDLKVKEELMKIIDDESIYYELIGYYDLLINITNKESNFNYASMLYAYNRIEDILSMYYTKKYNLPMEENFEIMANLHKEAIINILKKDYKNVYTIELDKMYFNSEYKNNHSKSLIKSSESIENEYEDFVDEKNDYEILDINDKCLKGKSKEIKKEIKKNEYIVFKNNTYNLKFDEITNQNINITYNFGFLNVIYNDGDNIKIYNTYSEYFSKIAYKFLNNQLNEDKFTDKEITVNCSINNDILSIYTDDKAYNIDLNTGKKASLNQLLKASKTNKEDLNNQIKNDIYEYSIEDVDHSQDYYKEYSEKRFQKLTNDINEVNINNYNDNKSKSFYLDENGKLNVIYEFSGLVDDYTINMKISEPYSAQLKNSEIKKLNLNSFDNNYNLNFINKELVITSLKDNKIIYTSNSEFINQIIQEIGVYKYKNIYINGNILSVVTEDVIYNIDLKNEKILSLDELIQAINLESNDVHSQITNDIYNHTIKEVDYLEACAELTEEEKMNFLDFLTEKNYMYFHQNGIKTAHLDQDGKLVFNTMFRKVDEETRHIILDSTPILYSYSEEINGKIITKTKKYYYGINEDLKNYYEEQIIIGEPYNYEVQFADEETIKK